MVQKTPYLSLDYTRVLQGLKSMDQPITINGLPWLLCQSRRKAIEDAKDKVGDTFDDAAEGAKDVAESATEDTKDKTDDATEGAKEKPRVLPKARKRCITSLSWTTRQPRSKHIIQGILRWILIMYADVNDVNLAKRMWNAHNSVS